MTTQSIDLASGSFSLRNRSTPTLASPIALSIPGARGRSTMRHGALPSRSSGVMDFVTIPPMVRGSMTSAISRMYPQVPAAAMIGFRSVRPARWTDVSDMGGRCIRFGCMLSRKRPRAIIRIMSITADRIAQFEKMAREDPTNDMAHFSLGNAYLQSGRAAEAAKALENCIAVNPHMSKAYQLAGQAMIEAGWADKA